MGDGKEIRFHSPNPKIAYSSSPQVTEVSNSSSYQLPLYAITISLEHRSSGVPSTDNFRFHSEWFNLFQNGNTKLFNCTYIINNLLTKSRSCVSSNSEVRQTTSGSLLIAHSRRTRSTNRLFHFLSAHKHI